MELLHNVFVPKAKYLGARSTALSSPFDLTNLTFTCRRQRPRSSWRMCLCPRPNP